MWTNEDTANLRSFRTIIDDDNVRFKEIIKQKLMNNFYIAHLLDDKKSEDEIDELFGVNILPYYASDLSQSEVENILCYEAGFEELYRYNKVFKHMQIVFHILCHDTDKNINVADVSVARHDLLAALIRDQFDYTTDFGPKIHCVSDKPGLVDSKYVSRVLIFEAPYDNNIVKTIDGVPRLINKTRQWISDEDIRRKNPKPES